MKGFCFLQRGSGGLLAVQAFPSNITRNVTRGMDRLQKLLGLDPPFVFHCLVGFFIFIFYLSGCFMGVKRKTNSIMFFLFT